MKPLRNSVITTIIVAISSYAPAFSQDDTNKKEATSGRWLSAGFGFPDYSQPFQGQIGLGIGYFPEYEGSDIYGASALPLIDIRKSGAFFLKGGSINVNDGLASAGLTIFHLSYVEEAGRRMQLVMGPLVRAYGGRDERDNDVLIGLGDIDPSVSIGGFLEFNAGTWLANVAVLPQDVGNDKDGLLVTLDFEHITAVSNGLKITTGISTSWADDDYMQAYFGVTDAQAARTGLSRFGSEAGFKDVGLKLTATYSLSPRWSLDGQVGYWRLLDGAADSPIVKGEGSADQVRGLVGLSFQF